MASNFHLTKARDGGFYFTLKTDTGHVLLSSPMYLSKAAAEVGIAAVKTNAPEDARYERRADKNTPSYFVLKAANNQIIGTSQIYLSASEMEEAILSATESSLSAEIVDRTAGST